MKLRDDLGLILRQSSRWALVAVMVVIPTIYFLSGFYSVGAEERGVVMRFGKVIHTHVLPGMHYHLPWPIEKVRTLQATALRSTEIDFSARAPQSLQPELTTGDEDLVDVSILVQYNINDPAQFIHSSNNAEQLLQEIAQAETLIYISANAIDQLLTTGRTRLQNQLKANIQSVITDWGLGIRVTSVQIRRLEPPASIKKSFDNVARARSEKQKLIQETLGENNTQLAQARSQANQIRSEAEAFATELLERAQGDRDHFLATWEAYQQAPLLTRQRLYLEKLESILNNTQVTLVNPKDQGG